MSANQDQATFAARYVAAQYGVEVDQDTADWYDAVHPRSGAKYEVKSTHTKLADGSPGRFRLWKDQHESLLASDRAGTAWYVFVLFDKGDTIIKHRRMRPQTVTRVVDGIGAGQSWEHSGHQTRRVRQKKVPWTGIFQ